MPATDVFTISALLDLIEGRTTTDLWVDGGGGRTWADFGLLVRATHAACSAAGVRCGEIVVTPGESELETLAWLFGAALAGAVVAPLRQERHPEVENWRQHVAPAWIVRGDKLQRLESGAHSAHAAALLAPLVATQRAGLVLATGGTTGKPKLVLHDFDVLLREIAVGQSPHPRRLLPLMRFDHIGGLDMAWRAMARGHVLVKPPSDLSPAAVVAAVERYGVEVLPATPSWLSLLLASEALDGHRLSSLRAVPYGAEPMPAGLLARLRGALPHVVFAQRFGTSETGALPVTSTGDGLLLDQPGYRWKIVDGELWILSPSRALGYLGGEQGGMGDDGWYRTGDLAEQLPDGALRVLGRREEMINVGGEKVLPTEVEGVLLLHPSVADCRVYPEPNALLGQVVAAELVWRGPVSDLLAVKRDLHAFASKTLPRHKLPAVLKLVAEVDTTRNMKKSRLPISK
jgi:acyl-CoA synthetase (AMP-forming)/AMP-acid ligase II